MDEAMIGTATNLLYCILKDNVVEWLAIEFNNTVGIRSLEIALGEWKIFKLRNYPVHIFVNEQQLNTSTKKILFMTRRCFTGKLRMHRYNLVVILRQLLI